MSSVVSLPSHTFLLGSLSTLSGLTSIVHILSPEIDNCPSWISRREKMTVENISLSISVEECCRPDGVEPATSWSQVGHASNWATDLNYLYMHSVVPEQYRTSLKSTFDVNTLIQSTFVISNSKALSEILRDIRTSTYQICRIEEKKIICLTTFNKFICNWTLKVDILKILRKRGEIAP